ncbi:ATP-binding protein, partial [Candidatus Poribacteria bacterium]|nr:ATP-binding protein [Candidatus Poribacteria bacterium]
MTDKFDDAFQQADAENTGQRVYYTLQELKQYPDATRKRWGWELLQNAHDARQVEDKREIIVEIKYEQEELVFSHNGKGFSAAEIAHLIRSGSTKNETDETTYGQYGTGLLTTHLLSRKIQISGQLNDDKNWFDFSLVRDDDSPEALLKSLDKAKDAFKHSISQNKPSQLGDLTTRFRIPIIEENAKRSVKTGIETLKQCAPYVLIFNETFRSISIKDYEGTLRFEVVSYPESKLNMPQKIMVIEHNNEKKKRREYLLTQGKEKTSVIVPLKSHDGGTICLLVENTPRLFKGFPLVGTEFFSFPAVINSPNFTVTSDRDSVPLNKDSEVNQTNLEIIEEACALLVDLVDYASSNEWRYQPRWLNVPLPLTKSQSSPSMDWLRKCVGGNLIEKIRQTPIILNTDNNRIAPEKAKLLLAESETGVKALWDLFDGIKGQRELLPKREEAMEWCNTVESWADVYQNEPMSSFKEVRNGRKLASAIQEYTRKDNEWSTIKDLQNLLRDGVSAVEWLNRLHDFFNENGLREAVREYYIVIDQSGCLDKLSALHRDPGIDEELKEIAKMLGWSIRQGLRDIRLTSLNKEEGRGDMTQDEVVDTLRQKLLDRANENPDSDFKEASRRLFAWIVNQKDYSRLRGFPVFAEDTDSDDPRIIHLPRLTQDNVLDNERPLGPIKSWPNDLQDYAELFPRRHIVANIFFEDVSDPDVWQKLEEDGLIRKDVIIRDCREISFEALQSCSPLTEKVNHESEKKIAVTDIA